MRVSKRVGTAFGATIGFATLFAVPAAAAVMITTIDGVVTQGFSTALSAKPGDSFSLVVKTDLSYPHYSIDKGHLHVYLSLGSAAPAVLTIGKDVHVFNNSTRIAQSELFDSTPGQNEINFLLYDYQFTPGNPAISFLDSIQLIFQGASLLPLDANYTTPFNISASGAGFYDAHYAILTAAGADYVFETSYNLSATSIRSVVDTGVPEPSMWILMLAGFGLAGAALRRGGTPHLSNIGRD